MKTIKAFVEGHPLLSYFALVFATYYLVFTAALWVVIGAIALANHGHLSRRPPLRRRMA